MADEKQHDWYKILGCDIDSTVEQIRKASRTLSLKYHPDKTDAPDAPEKFLLVQKAKEILLDETKRKEIDDAIRAKLKRKEHETIRSSTMDSKRKKMKEEFEARLAKEAGTGTSTETSGDATSSSSSFASSSRSDSKSKTKSSSYSKDDLDKLRSENKIHMANGADAEAEEELRRAREFMMHRTSMVDENRGSSQIKIKWRRSGVSESDSTLYQLLKPYGDIEDITIREDSGTSAIVTFTHSDSADRAVRAFDLSTQYKVSKLEIKARDRSVSGKAAVFTHSYNPSTTAQSSASCHASSSHNSTSDNKESDLLREMRRVMEREALLRALEKEESGIPDTSGNAISKGDVSVDSARAETDVAQNTAPSGNKPNSEEEPKIEKFVFEPVLTVMALRQKEIEVLGRLRETAERRKMRLAQPVC